MGSLPFWSPKKPGGNFGGPRRGGGGGFSVGRKGQGLGVFKRGPPGGEKKSWGKKPGPKTPKGAGTFPEGTFFGRKWGGVFSRFGGWNQKKTGPNPKKKPAIGGGGAPGAGGAVKKPRGGGGGGLQKKKPGGGGPPPGGGPPRFWGFFRGGAPAQKKTFFFFRLGVRGGSEKTGGRGWGGG